MAILNSRGKKECVQRDENKEEMTLRMRGEVKGLRAVAMVMIKRRKDVGVVAMMRGWRGASLKLMFTQFAWDGN